jgi:RNA recognition motif-containing protein
MQGSKLYVGNLSYSVTGSQLKELFSQYGEIKDAVVIKDRDTDRSKGFGFIELSSPAEAEKACDALNGKEYEGRSLRVNEAKQREPRENRRRF